jgi:peptidoglycan/LPS O-acetylase OafA/YrhL
VANLPDGVDRAAPASWAGNGYLPTLDGWRAIAIALVVIDHAFNSTVCAAGSVRWCNRFMVGQTGVNLFFGISGFLICTRLLQEIERHSTLSLRGFYIRRALRILPPALFYLAVITVLALTRQIGLSERELTASLFFYRNYLGPEAGFYTTHFWSLSLEEQFYLVWPTLLVLLLAMPRLWAVICSVMLAILVAGWRQAALLHDLVAYGHLARGFFLRTDVRADGLLLGAAAALVVATGVGRAVLTRMPSWVWLITGGVYFGVVAHFGLRPTIWESALVPLLISWTAYHPDALPARALEWPPLRWVGRLSYSLYIWQQCFFPPADIATPFPQFQRWPLAVPAALACAVASYYLLERPSIRLGHRWAPPAMAGRVDVLAQHLDGTQRVAA